MAAGQTTDPREADGGGEPSPSGYVVPDKPAEDKDDEKEHAVVQKWFKDYEKSRKFDENYRKQIAIDRRYASGTSDNSWAVTTNLIGAYIDILVSLLYARDPDVSVRKAPQTDDAAGDDMEQFARTAELVISRLWKRANLKRNAQKQVRSTLSVAEGWLKVNLVAEKMPMPEVQQALNDKRETLRMLEGMEKELDIAEGEGDPDEIAARKQEIADAIEELEGKLEVAVKKALAIDFVPAESFQCSTDVKQVCDHLDADWNANEMYVPKCEILERFPDLDEDDVKEAKLFYQGQPKEMTSRDVDNILPQGQLTARDAEGWTSNQSEQEAEPFCRVIEIWDRKVKKIRTMIDGVKCWAKQPYDPPYPTSRFFPYFGLMFFHTDGDRHPQSLSWRMYKLQDEFSCVRSNYRLTRERSLPAVIFNNTGLDEIEARKLQDAKAAELIGLKPAEPDTPIGDLFAQKPIPQYDPRLFDVTPIIQDMERVSGVQEALQAAVSSAMPKTATEAQIQQSGTNARTTADRDALEWMLTDLAQYTLEQALQCLEPRDAQRIAGVKAFWPAHMDIDDLFTLCEITIAAGSTGKPRAQMDQQAWATVMPLIKELQVEIEQARATGNMPMAVALENLIKETMLRMGDDTDVERFIPQIPPGAAGPPKPPPPKVSVSLKANLPPEAAITLIAPTLAADAAAAPHVPTPAPGSVPATGAPPAPGPHMTAQPEVKPTGAP